jgi:hypothetical protein
MGSHLNTVRTFPIRWMHAAWFVCVWCVMLSTAAAEELPVAEQVRTLVASLSSDDFTVRQAAEDSLQKLGSDAFNPLAESLNKATSDSAQIILSSLERIWLSSSEADAEPLERRLQDLTWEPGPYQPAIEAILQRHAMLREARAAKALRRLHAYIKMGPDVSMGQLMLEANGEFPKVIPQSIYQIVIPRSWKGTHEDLWHFQRLANSQDFQLYYVQGSITEADRLQIASRSSRIVLQERSEVVLGISSDQFNRADRQGCWVKDVEPGGAAEAAGVQPFDTITKIDDVQIHGFQELVQTLKSKRAYQEFTMTIQRDYQIISVHVIGLPWESRRVEYPPAPPLPETPLSIKYHERPKSLIPLIP